MKKTRIMMSIAISVVVLLSSSVFAGCDDKNDAIEDFYGMYNYPNYIFYEVSFVPEDTDAETLHRKIVGVKNSGFVYCEFDNKYDKSSYKFLEQRFDSNLLCKLEDLLFDMGSSIELKKNCISFNTSKKEIHFKKEDVKYKEDSGIIELFKNEFTVGNCRYEKANPFSVIDHSQKKVVGILAMIENIEALDGTLWSIEVKREYVNSLCGGII